MRFKVFTWNPAYKQDICALAQTAHFGGKHLICIDRLHGDGMKGDAVVKSWKESDEWDLIKDKGELIVNFRLDFECIISYQ